MPNSTHNRLSGSPPRSARTTNSTRCSRTCILFQGIVSAPPRSLTLARKRNGSPETMCKGCHGTEHPRTWGPGMHAPEPSTRRFLTECRLSFNDRPKFGELARANWASYRPLTNAAPLTPLTPLAPPTPPPFACNYHHLCHT